MGRDLDAALVQHRELRKEPAPAGGLVPQGPSFDEVLDRWLISQETRCKPRTAQISHQRARVLRRLFAGRRAAAITSEAVEELIRWRRDQGVTDVTINADLTTLRQVLRFGHFDAGMLEKLPVRVKLLRTVKKKRRRTFGRIEIQKLIKAAHQMERFDVELFIRIAASTGLRLDEILHLRWEDIDFKDRRIDVRSKEWKERRYDRSIRRMVDRTEFWSPKSHHERSIWVDSAELFDALHVHRERQECGDGKSWVFQGRQKGLRLTTISDPLREVFKETGLYEKGKLAHTFRHSVATALIESGVDLETVRDWLGHQQVTTTALYLHSTDRRKRQAAKRLRLV